MAVAALPILTPSPLVGMTPWNARLVVLHHVDAVVL
jgi:hypothetical protein